MARFSKASEMLEYRLAVSIVGAGTYGVAKIAKPPVEISEIRLNVEKFVWWSPEK
jgi:hypothetical protein